jgi:hypothetical protein
MHFLFLQVEPRPGEMRLSADMVPVQVGDDDVLDLCGIDTDSSASVVSKPVSITIVRSGETAAQT